MINHPANDWNWEDTAEVKFQEWFNGDYGSPYSLRSEYFLDNIKIEDENQRKDIMIKWLHSAYLNGYNMGRLSEADTNFGGTE